MFDNVGKKIQSISSGIFCIQSLLSLIIGIIVWGSLADEYMETAGVFAFIGITVFGIIFAWLSQLFLQAFGKITESCELHIQLQASNKSGTRTQTYRSAAAPTGPNTNSAQTSSANGPRINSDGSWVCTCARHNSSYVSTCTCGKNKREILMSKN